MGIGDLVRGMIGTVIVFALAGALWLAGVWCAVGFAVVAEPPEE